MLALILLVGLLGTSIDAVQGKESVQIINHPHKNEYISAVVGSDKHKYGYELKENKHFHHTTTEEDGVRLGCYGYVLFGKKYSTQYVADVKGYRPVHTHDLITVYPKSGGERKASFVGDFNENEQLSKNIRYFFPDGCKGIEHPISILQMPKTMMIELESQIGVRIDKKVDQPIRVPSITFLPPAIDGLLPPMLSKNLQTPSNALVKPLATQRSPNSNPNKDKPPVKKAETVVEKTVTIKTPVTPSSKPTLATITSQTTAATTAVPRTTASTPLQQEAFNPPQDFAASTPTIPKSTAPLQTRPTPSRLTKIPVPFDSVLRMVAPPSPDEDSCKNACCVADENTPKLSLPIPMMHLIGKEGSCESFAQLVVPINGLSNEDLRALSSVSVNELIKRILHSLS